MDNFVDYDKKFLNFSMRQSLLSKEDEIQYIKNWQIHKDQKSLNKIVSSHLRLIISIANKFKNYGIPINELAQEGNIGLMQAVEKFDLNKEEWDLFYSSSIYNNAQVLSMAINKKFIFLGLENRLIKIDKKTGFIKEYKFSFLGRINDIIIDGKEVWLGTSSGLIKFLWKRDL